MYGSVRFFESMLARNEMRERHGMGGSYEAPTSLSTKAMGVGLILFLIAPFLPTVFLPLLPIGAVLFAAGLLWIIGEAVTDMMRNR